MGIGYTDQFSLRGSFGLDEIHKINAHHSFNVFAFISANSYGAEEKIGASYTYQFK